MFREYKPIGSNVYAIQYNNAKDRKIILLNHTNSWYDKDEDIIYIYFNKEQSIYNIIGRKDYFIEDTHEVMSEEEFNSKYECLYSDTTRPPCKYCDMGGYD